jgi:hypothetical protein
MLPAVAIAVGDVHRRALAHTLQSPEDAARTRRPALCAEMAKVRISRRGQAPGVAPATGVATNAATSELLAPLLQVQEPSELTSKSWPGGRDLKPHTQYPCWVAAQQGTAYGSCSPSSGAGQAAPRATPRFT